MVGGIVREVFRVEDKVCLIVRGTGEDKDRQVAIDLEGDVPAIVPGDSIWWQAREALWTPRDRDKYSGAVDIRVARSGYTYDVNTLWRKAAKLCAQGICPVCADRENAMSDGLGSLYCNNCGASYDMRDMLGKEEA